MRRLIRESDVQDMLDDAQCISDGEYSYVCTEDIKLSKLPTIDAVSVVRCEKCRHGIKAHGISDGWVLCSKPYVTDTVGNMMHRCDWFCADGDRKKEQ